VVAKLLLASDVILLGMLVSSSMVTTYVLTGYAARLALNLYALAAGAATPGLGGVIGEKALAKAARLREEMWIVTWLFATVVGATILMWNRSFLGLWVGSQNYAGTWPNLLISLTIVQSAFIRNDSYVIDAALRPRLRVGVGAAAAALTIALMVLLTPSLGIVGVCLGLLGGRLAQSIAYPMLVRACLGPAPGVGPATHVRPLAMMGLLFAACAWLGQQMLVSSWMAWGACVAITLPALLGVALVTGLPATSRRTVALRARAVLNSEWRRT
jgi:hypothetical protein